MTKFLLSVFLACLLLFCFSQGKPDNISLSILKAYSDVDEIYRRAEQLSLQAGSDDGLQAKADELYREALVGFNNLAPGIEKTGSDSLCFFVHLKTGFIEFYFDSINAAKKDYLSTIALKQRLPSVPDSFLFIPFMYTGGIYYTQN